MNVEAVEEIAWKGLTAISTLALIYLVVRRVSRKANGNRAIRLAEEQLAKHNRAVELAEEYVESLE